MMPTDMSSLLYRDSIIRVRQQSASICLSDLWRGQGSPNGKEPLAWLSQPLTQNLLRKLAGLDTPDAGDPQITITEIPSILESIQIQSDESLSVFSRTDLAVLYAQFLANESYEWAMTTLVDGEVAYSDVGEDAEGRAESSISRRLLMTAGWSIPIILGVLLTPEKGFGHSDATLTNGGHIDSPL
jgi:hypothetical protein